DHVGAEHQYPRRHAAASEAVPHGADQAGGAAIALVLADHELSDPIHRDRQPGEPERNERHSENELELYARTHCFRTKCWAGNVRLFRGRFVVRAVRRRAEYAMFGRSMPLEQETRRRELGRQLLRSLRFRVRTFTLTTFSRNALRELALEVAHLRALFAQSVRKLEPMRAAAIDIGGEGGRLLAAPREGGLGGSHDQRFSRRRLLFGNRGARLAPYVGSFRRERLCQTRLGLAQALGHVLELLAERPQRSVAPCDGRASGAQAFLERCDQRVA